jgi:hydroxyethylthiazole kinase-like uncharacterized protein yjeF
LADQWAARFANLLGGEDRRGEPEYRGSVPLVGDALEILTPLEMAAADAWAVENGTSGLVLMERAGLAVAEAARRMVPAGARISVMTGPGNNGGDGFVAARILAEAGYLVSVGLLAARDRMKGDAAFAAASWTGFTKGLAPSIVNEADLVIDALFGAGLDRPVDGMAAQTIDAVNHSGVRVLAVDLPSGIDGRTGAILGSAIEAEETVTFFRVKPGHLLMPGREHVGRLTVADIGINVEALTSIGAKTWRNKPGLWSLPPLSPEGHKYTRGHAVVVSGPAHRTGAARLSARGALRAGAGLVTVASPPDALAANAAHLTAIMLLPMDGAGGLASILTDTRRNAVVMGPGLGLNDATIGLVEAALGSSAAVVLDADALTSFAGKPDRLFNLIKGRDVLRGRDPTPVVLTPHEGEFARLFPNIRNESKLERARLAAEMSGAVVILKGPDTVVAAPTGEASIADNAPPQLATAGSGDVLSGMIGGLLAQSMPAFQAASAAVWLHGEAGLARGRGLIAEDIPEALPAVFTELAKRAR